MVMMRWYIAVIWVDDHHRNPNHLDGRLTNDEGPVMVVEGLVFWGNDIRQVCSGIF